MEKKINHLEHFAHDSTQAHANTYTNLFQKPISWLKFIKPFFPNKVPAI